MLLTRGNSIVRDYDYDAYGAEKNALPSDDNPFRYTGEYTDSETGLVYLRNRMYDPETGRFISEDPIRDGLNWYAYCEGNPVNFIDPWGLKDERYVITEKDPLNMRAKAGTDSEIIGTLERGTEVEFTGEETTEKIDGHYWAKLTYKGDPQWKTGWVAAEYLGTANPSGKKERSAPIIDRPEPTYHAPKGKEYEEKINIGIDLFHGWAKDFSETTYVDDPQDPNAPDDDTMYFNSMADAAAASSLKLNEMYWSNYYGGKK